jgi:hypothetical protein
MKHYCLGIAELKNESTMAVATELREQLGSTQQGSTEDRIFRTPLYFSTIRMEFGSS